MKYTVYRITNKINGKYYIGKHQTKNLDDGYMGSGKLITRAIRKYGIDNFTKEILFVFDTEEEMNNKEKELVVISENTYNLCPGGKGGFGYINKNMLNSSLEGRLIGGRKGGKIISEKLKNDKNFRYNFSNKIAIANRKRDYSKRCCKGTTGLKFSDITKIKMSISSKGANNSQYGTCWVTNRTENKKIRKNELALYINQGYYKGRKLGPIA